MRLTDVISTSAEGGASRFGVHFLKDLACPYEWALRNLLPTADGRGLAPITREAGALDLGLAFHKFAEVWYASRCATGQDNGEPDLDCALAAADAIVVASANLWSNPDSYDEARSDVRKWGRSYHAQYGPDGADPEWPRTMVFCDDSGPWIERELSVPIGPVGMEFTCRIDLVATHLGSLGAWDHKTTSPNGFWPLTTSIDLDAQPTGNLLALRHAMPDIAHQLSFWVANIINKYPAQRPTAKSPPAFGRARTHRTQADLDYFHSMVHTLLLRLDEWVDNWAHLVEIGIDPLVAIGTVFPRFGQFSGHCQRWGRACDFSPICVAAGSEAQNLTYFRTRYPNELAATTTNANEEDDHFGL